MSSHIPHVHVPWHHPHHPPSEKRLLDGVDIANPLHSGYMYKEAHSHLVFHKRFFVLFPGALVYYEKESEYNKDVARGTLEHRHKAIGLEGLFLTKPEKKPKGGKFCFILHAPDKANERHDFLLVAESREVRKHWIEALQDQNPNLLESAHHVQAIDPDTPKQMRKIRAHSEEPSSESLSSLVTSSLTTTTAEVHSQENGETRPTLSPQNSSQRQPMFRLASGESSTSEGDQLHLDIQHLDIQHLDIREGPSDVEDNV